MQRIFSVLSMVVAMFCNSAATGDEVATVSYCRDIAPILLDNCLACHGPKKAEGGYRVDTFDQLLKAGDSGETPVASTPDQPGELLRRLVCGESERMPADADPLSAAQVELIKQWIAGGAKFDGESPTQPLALVIPPIQFAGPPGSYGQPVPITANCFTPDGQQVVTSGYHELLVWNVQDGQLARRIKNVGQRVYGLAFTTDGQTLAVGCGEPGRYGEVRLIEFNTGAMKAVVSRAADVVLDLAFRPGTNELAIGLADSTIRVVDVQSLKDVRTLASHADWVTGVAWSEDGTRLASSSRDKSAKVYDAATGELLASYVGHGAIVRGVALLSDNKQAVSVGADNKLHRWEIEGAKKVAEVGLGSEGQRLLRQANSLFVACADNRVLRIDLGNNAVAQEFKGHGDWVLSLSCPMTASGEGLQRFASGAFNGEVRIWNVADATSAHQWIAKP